MTTPKAGWYQDPQDPQGLRYWDGAQWTSQTCQPTPPPPPLSQSSAFGDLTLMPPPQAVSNPTRKGVVLKSAGSVVTILGALPLAFAAIIIVNALVRPNDPGSQWAGLGALMLIGLGTPVLTIGLVMLLSGKARERRGELASETSNATGAVSGVKESLVAPILGIVFSVIPFISLLGLMLSLYGYFGNKAGSKARLVGLIGIFVNLGVALFQVLRM